MIRENDRHGLASIPSFRRWRSVLWRSITSKESENFSQSSSFHWSRRGGGREDEDAANAAPEEEFGEDETGFDGLAESDIVGD